MVVSELLAQLPREIKCHPQYRHQNAHGHGQGIIMPQAPSRIENHKKDKKGHGNCEMEENEKSPNFRFWPENTLDDSGLLLLYEFNVKLSGPKVLRSFGHIDDDVVIHYFARKGTCFLGKIDPELLDYLLFGIRISQFEPGLEQYPVKLVLVDGFLHDSE